MEDGPLRWALPSIEPISFLQMFLEACKNVDVQGTHLKANLKAFRKAPKTRCIQDRGEGFATVKVVLIVSKFVSLPSLPRIRFLILFRSVVNIVRVR